MLIVAHRTPTTAAGCAALAAAGAHAFELDVQLRGTRLVVSHYLPFLGVRGWLEHDNGRFRWRSGPPRDPALLDIVALIPPQCLILLDPKETEPCRRRALHEALVAALPERDRLRVSTDRADDLERYRAAGFQTWRTIKTGRALGHVISSGPVPDAGVSVRHTLLDAASVERLHGVTDTVVAWTVRNVARAARLREFGVDGITTDSRGVMTRLAGQDPPRPRG